MNNRSKGITIMTLGTLALGISAFVFAQNSQSRMIEPNAGTWKTWVIPSGSSLRLPAPDRSQDSAEIAELKAIPRDAQALESVAYWNAGAPSYRWVQIMQGQYDKIPIAPVRNARSMSLMNVAIYDAIIAAWDSKYAHKRARPSSRDASLEHGDSNTNQPLVPQRTSGGGWGSLEHPELHLPERSSTF